MSQREPGRDGRASEVIRILKILASEGGNLNNSTSYSKYRQEQQPEAPSATTINRIFGSWRGALTAAGVDKNADNRTPKSNEQLLQELREVARILDVAVLSSHAYDEYRDKNNPDLPSSSLIRKRFGTWSAAVEAVGLEAPQRAAPRKPTPPEALHALRRASSLVLDPLTPQEYAKLAEDSEEEWPDVAQILTIFTSWEDALEASNCEQGDEIDPELLWTVEEARCIATSAQRLLRAPLDESSYSKLREGAVRPMPDWKTLCLLLDVPQRPQVI